MPVSSDRPQGEGRKPPHVVILGGGYGGVHTALRLQKAARRGDIDLTIISRENFFLFYPMLAEVVSGNIEPPHIVSPIRRLIRHAHFHQAEVEDIDIDSNSVRIHYPGHRDYVDISYDHLVIAVGSSADLSGMPGMSEHAFPLKTMGDALFLRNHLIGVLEHAEVEEDPQEKSELLTFVVVGGGYTGVEVAAEINDFTREAVGSYSRISADEIKVILLHGGERILPSLSPELAQFSHRLLERYGIEVRLNCRISGATVDRAMLNDGTAIPTRTLVAAVGSAPNRVLDSLPCARDGRGRLVVDEYLSVPGYPNVWSVGDCASIPDVNNEGQSCPPTAQFALREARHLARNILASIKGEPLRPFSYRNLGVFVPLGKFSAAAEVLNFKISGFPAWWLYRTYYLIQLPRLKRKLQVVIDWTLALMFNRDIVKMDLTRSEGLTRSHYEPGEIVFRQDEIADDFYIIAAGTIQIYRDSPDGETIVTGLGPGEYFGEMALLDGTRHTSSARALTPVDLIVMSGSDFATLTTSSTRFGELVEGVMQQRQSDGQSPEVP